MILIFCLFYFVHAENVVLQPGKPFIVQPPGYPNVEDTTIEKFYNFQTARDETIFVTCKDYRTIGDSKNPCEAFSLTMNDGEKEKKFCSLIKRDDVSFETSSNKLQMHLKVPIPQLFLCFVRSTEPTIPETIEISQANKEIKIESQREPVPFMDRTWLIKNPNKETVNINCGFGMRPGVICKPERYEITVGSEKKIYCTSERISRESKGEDVILRAVYDWIGDGSFDCTVSISEPAQNFIPPPTRPPPAPVHNKVFLKSNQIKEFTSPGYPFGDESTRSDTTYEFETLEEAQIQVYCEDFRIGDDEACQEYVVKFEDGINVSQLCKYTRDVYQVSKTNKLKVNMKFVSPVAVKCVARTTAEEDVGEINLEVNDLPYRFSMDGLTPEPYRHSVYKFKTKQGVRISIQCDITFSDRKPCSEDIFEVYDGSELKTFCGGQKIVVISQKNYLKARLQLDKFGHERFFCVAQAITGDNPNQHKNVASEEVDSRERGSAPGRERMTCDCGRRFWPKENKRIFEGKEARKGEYTWMVGIRDHDNFQRCGGSLISKYHILTAAHCMVDSDVRNKSQIWDTIIAIGAHDRTLSQTDVESHKETQFIEVLEKNVFIPEEWWTFKRNYDISVLVMEKEAIFGIHVGPACMPKVAPKLWNTEVKITGWGRTETQDSAVFLKETKLFILDGHVCSMDPWMMCAYKNWTGTCKGDSGSPLVHWDADTNRYIQVSLVSFGRAFHCTPTVTGNSNVTYHYDWIESIIKKTKPSIELCTKANK